jgi:glycosyltransferase involved in cell wall biosynthesis
MVTEPVAADTPQVSVIIPVFNDETAVLICLEGLRRQRYPATRMQVLLIDNGSTPPLKVADSYPFDLRIERCETPGSYAARNAGARVASGEVFAFTDADCVPRVDWLEQGIKALRVGNDEYVVGGDAVITEPDVRSGTALYQYIMGFELRENIEYKGFAGTGNLFCTRQQFQRIGPFDERLFSGGDREWGWRANKLGIETRYTAFAVVTTPPRTSLSGAIRQARRVAAGRYHLRALGLDWAGPEAVQPLRSSMGSAVQIWKSKLPYRERFKVLVAAIIIKGAGVIERIRLRFGTIPERR